MPETDVRNNHRFSLDPDNHKFIRVRTAVRNPVLSDDSAWAKAQPFFDAMVPDYQKYRSYLPLIRKVFGLRRGSFLGKIPGEEASRGVQQLVTVLTEEQQDEITGFVAGIRDFFDRSQPKKVRRDL